MELGEQLAAIEAFRDQLIKSLAGIVGELAKATRGNLPNETRRAIHAHLKLLSDAGIEVPEERLQIFPGLDLLVSLFPPPDPSE